MLRGWDGHVSVDSPAATVYELFLAEMEGRMARAKAPRTFAAVLGEPLGPITPYNFLCYRRTGHLARLLREQPAGWFSRPWPEETADALAAVMRRLRTEHGTDPSRLGLWPLAHAHAAPSARPQALARSALQPGTDPLRRRRRHDQSGSGAAARSAGVGGQHRLAAQVVDVGAWRNSRFSLPGGQSGNPLSPHYDDLFPLWQRGEGVPIAWTAEEVRQASDSDAGIVAGVSTLQGRRLSLSR